MNYTVQFRSHLAWAGRGPGLSGNGHAPPARRGPADPDSRMGDLQRKQVLRTNAELLALELPAPPAFGARQVAIVRPMHYAIRAADLQAQVNSLFRWKMRKKGYGFLSYHCHKEPLTYTGAGRYGGRLPNCNCSLLRCQMHMRSSLTVKPLTFASDYVGQTIRCHRSISLLLWWSDGNL